jgi:hypothetical protein
MSRRSKYYKLLTLNAEGGTRTRTGVAAQRILSPLCLPFHHPGASLLSITYVTLSETGSGSVADTVAGRLLFCDCFRLV